MTPAPPPGTPETAVTLAALAPVVENSARIPWAHLDVGAPMNVILWISIGAGFGVWNRRLEHKGNLVGAFMASFVLTLGLVVGIPKWTGYQWDDAGFQAAMGMLLAFTSQNWGPQALALLGRLDAAAFLQSLLPAHWLKPRRDTDDPR